MPSKSKAKKEIELKGLSNIIEDCIFDIAKLKELKNLALKLGIPENDISQYTEQLLKYLTGTLKALEEHIPFYFKSCWTAENIDNYASQDNSTEKQNPNTEADKIASEELKQKIKERDRLLLTLKERIARIHAHISST